MNNKTADFLDLLEVDPPTRSALAEYVEDQESLKSLSNNLSVVGSVSNFDSKQEFEDSLSRNFDIIDSTNNLILLWSPKQKVASYVHVEDLDFPVFYTTATKTDQMPKTVGKYLKGEFQMSRMWLAKQHVESLRKEIDGRYSNLICSFFTAKRSQSTTIPAKEREDYDRTISYWADDGMSTFLEMKRKYGVLPTNMKFELPGQFKIQVTQKGVHTSLDGGLVQITDLVEYSIDRLRLIKQKINSMSFGVEEYDHLPEQKIPHSKPWAIKLNSRPSVEDVNNLQKYLENDDIEFNVVHYDPNPEKQSFSAELMDTTDYGKTILRTKENTIRVYPREETGMDQSLRIYNFVDDNIDSNCEAVEVV